MKRSSNTFHTPLVPSLNELGFPAVPKESDKAAQLLEDLWTIGSCWRSPGPWWGGYNPEKYLNRWAAILSARDDLWFDVIGWAFSAAWREVEYIKQKKLTAYDFLTARKPRALLVRVAKWAEARLRYHRVGLQLTFYKRDALAGQEPITSNVELITDAELLRRVGPVHLTLIASPALRQCVPDLEDLVKTSAKEHGWKLVPEATDFELVVNAAIYGGTIRSQQPGFTQIYTISTEIGLRTKANCRRGDEFVRLSVFPYRDSYYVWGFMGDLLDFNPRYAKAFRQAIDKLFETMGERTDADSKDDEAAWTASLWPREQDAEMEKRFLSPLQSERSEPVFHGISKLGLSWVNLLGKADKYINVRSTEQAWDSELKTNGQIIDPSSSIRITHDVGTFWQSMSSVGDEDSGFYVNTSLVGVWQRGVVFNFNGELRRRTVCIWGGGTVAMALPKDQSGPWEIANLGIRLTAKEIAVGR